MEALARQLLESPVGLLLPFTVAAGLVYSLDAREHLSQRGRRWLDRATLALLAGEAAGLIALCVSRIVWPVEWDFPHFYVAGRTAWEGRSFYDPHQLRQTYYALSATTPVPPAWLSEVGYWYLPPSALLLAPLGALPYRLALTVHYLLQAGFFAGAVYVLHRAMPIAGGRRGLIAALALSLAFAPVVSTFSVAQIVPGALFFVALAFALLPDRPTWSGAALALGSLYKHLLLIPAALAVLLGKRRVFGGYLATALACCAMSLAVFGTDAWTDFARFGPTSRPPSLAVDPVVQSLLGTLLRTFGRDPSPHLLQNILYWPHVLAAAALTLITLIACAKGRHGRHSKALSFGCLLALTLMVYPNTLYNTFPLLLPAFFALIAARHALPAPPMVVPVFVGTQYALVLVRPHAFIVLFLTWAFCLWALVRGGRDADDRPLTALH